MKKWIAFCAAALMLLCAGCGAAQPETTAAPTVETTTTPAETGIRNIILIIGDGMGLEHIAAGQLAAGKEFAFTDWEFVNVNTDSVDENGIGPVLTDSAAGATAMATGNLTVNRYIGKNYKGEDVTTILDLAAEKYGKATGIVTTDYLYGATPSGFSAHSMDRGNTSEIIRSQIDSGVDLLCGSYHLDCVLEQKAIQEAGYRFADRISEVSDTVEGEKAYWLLDLAGTSATVELKDAAGYALDFLSRDEDGFVLMIEQAHIDKFSEKNDFDSMVACVQSLGETVDAVMEWAAGRTDTAVIVTADHETGGLAVGTAPKYENKYHSGSGETVYYSWSTTTHTNAKVGAFLYGWDPEFSEYDYYHSDHLIKNCEIYRLMEEILDGTN